MLLYSNILLHYTSFFVEYSVYLYMYIFKGGGGVQVLILYRGLVVRVLSMQCVASTCASVGMGQENLKYRLNTDLQYI